jgi:hypothetical protein
MEPTRDSGKAKKSAMNRLLISVPAFLHSFSEFAAPMNSRSSKPHEVAVPNAG